MKVKEKRILYIDQLMELCISKGWYTRGDSDEYVKMLSMSHDGEKNITARDIVKIATDIMEHSDDPERELESYCFQIAEITHTFFEIAG